MMKQFERQLKDPLVSASAKPPVASHAVRTSIYRAERDQRQKTELLSAWEGEGGKPASLHDAPKGYGVFVNSPFTFSTKDNLE